MDRNPAKPRSRDSGRSTGGSRTSSKPSSRQAEDAGKRSEKPGRTSSQDKRDKERTAGGREPSDRRKSSSQRTESLDGRSKTEDRRKRDKVVEDTKPRSKRTTEKEQTTDKKNNQPVISKRDGKRRSDSLDKSNSERPGKSRSSREAKPSERRRESLKPEKPRTKEKARKEDATKPGAVHEVARRKSSVAVEDNGGDSDISEDNLREVPPPISKEPEQMKAAKPEEEEEEEEGEFNYDDEEFDSYEDDFDSVADSDDEEEESDDEDPSEDEEVTFKGHEVEKKLDSGNYDLQPTSKLAQIRMERQVNDVKSAIVRENSALGRTQRTVDDAAGAGRAQQDVERGRKEATINFSAAKVKQKMTKAANQARSRGDELLKMIRLDIVSLDHLNFPPVRYEAFMKTFGKTNSLQASTQTGEDNVEVEIQTDTVVQDEKWTQKPPNFGAGCNLDDPVEFKQSVLGVGDGSKKELPPIQYSHHNQGIRLPKFIIAAGQTLLTLIEEDRSRREGNTIEDLPQRDIDFADSISILRTQEVEFLKGRPVNLLEFSPEHTSTLITVHGYDSASEPDRNFICVWNVGQASRPLYALSSASAITSVSLAMDHPVLVFAGCEDGQVCLWDLRESTLLHQQVWDNVDDYESLWRSPTFTGSDVHQSPVTSVRPLPESGLADSVKSGAAAAMSAFQVVTVELSGGAAVIWTVLDAQRDFDKNLGLAHWGKVRMVPTTVLNLANLVQMEFGGGNGSAEDQQDDVNAYDIGIDFEDGSHVMIGAGDGIVIHAATQPDHRPTPRLYKPEIETSSACKSVAICPFDEMYMLIGCEDGSIRLHTATLERPLITWAGTVDNEPIIRVIWSPSRPCVFFILDTANRIHVWDLGAGDIYPAHTVQFADQINCFAVSCENGDPNQRQMLAIGLEEGRVEILHLKSEYRSEDADSCDRELDRFLHYVSII